MTATPGIPTYSTKFPLITNSMDSPCINNNNNPHRIRFSTGVYFVSFNPQTHTIKLIKRTDSLMVNMSINMGAEVIIM
ncbi:hypothetical protein TUM4249_16640 [Shewanella sp. KT0246]|nr:hypothetical protein TUM4249_16640 [Shewanella sp. KT0246]